MCGFTGLGLYLLFSITLAAAVALSTTKWPLALKSQKPTGRRCMVFDHSKMFIFQGKLFYAER